MKEFKMQKAAKAFITDAKGVKYEFHGPTIEQLDTYRTKLDAISKEDGKVLTLMIEFLASLGKCPIATLKQMPSEDFYELFTFVVSGEKKS